MYLPPVLLQCSFCVAMCLKILEGCLQKFWWKSSQTKWSQIYSPHETKQTRENDHGSLILKFFCKQNLFWLRMSRNIVIGAMVKYCEGIYITQVPDSCSSLWTMPAQCRSTFSCFFSESINCVLACFPDNVVPEQRFWPSLETKTFETKIKKRQKTKHWRCRHNKKKKWMVWMVDLTTSVTSKLVSAMHTSTFCFCFSWPSLVLGMSWLWIPNILKNKNIFQFPTIHHLVRAPVVADQKYFEGSAESSLARLYQKCTYLSKCMPLGRH